MLDMELNLNFELDWKTTKTKDYRLFKAGPFVIKEFGREIVDRGGFFTDYFIDIRVPNLGLISIGNRKTEAAAKRLCQQIANIIIGGCKFDVYSNQL